MVLSSLRSREAGYTRGYSAASSASATCRSTSTLGPAERVKTILLSLPSTKELAVDSPNTVQVREIVEGLTQAISKNQLAFGAFSETLVKLLQSALELPKTCTMPKRREIMWTQYGRLQDSLRSIWDEFLCKIDVAKSCRLFEGLLNDLLFESLVKDLFKAHEYPLTSTNMQLTKDECNILRYVYGYVMMKVKQKYLKQKSKEAAVYVECLSQLAVEGPDSSLSEYTRQWTDKVNRGGLFVINDLG